MENDQPAARGIAVDRARTAVARNALAGLYVGGVYLAIVAGVGGMLGADPADLWLVSVAALTVAVTLPSVSRRCERIALRLLYGERDSPNVDSTLRDHAAAAPGVEDATEELARVAAEATGAGRAEVWLRIGESFERAAAWPVERRDVVSAPNIGDVATLAGADHVVAVRSHGEAVGVITVAQGAGQLSNAAERVLGELAVAAGLFIRNARSAAALADRLATLERHAADLRDSRRRVVAAHDQERRRIERDIHDGAQQYLVALLVQMRLARQSVEDASTDAAAALSELEALATGALDRLGELTRGLDPPLLRESGLLAALREVPLARHVEMRGIGRHRHPLEVETAVYFAVLEAMQNAAKHAKAASTRVIVESRQTTLAFRVEDNGTGFDVSSEPGGAGLRNIARRLDEVGGRVSVVSVPGVGTTVAGRVERRDPQ